MLQIKIKNQPDDISCGPTSLHNKYEWKELKQNLTLILEWILRGKVDF